MGTSASSKGPGSGSPLVPPWADSSPDKPIPPNPQTMGFIGIGLALTILIERLATGPLGRWEYAEAIPVLPILDIGVAPLLQWILLPPLAAWVVRRQLT